LNFVFVIVSPNAQKGSERGKHGSCLDQMHPTEPCHVAFICRKSETTRIKLSEAFTFLRSLRQRKFACHKGSETKELSATAHDGATRKSQVTKLKDDFLW